jgi:hypothetical protein
MPKRLDLQEFERIEAEVDTVRPDGVAYVRHDNKLVSIGPTDSKLGTLVEVALINRGEGVCLTESQSITSPASRQRPPAVEFGRGTSESSPKDGEHEIRHKPVAVGGDPPPTRRCCHSSRASRSRVSPTG